MSYAMDIYAVGPLCCSVCTDAPRNEVAALVNREMPTGISSQWTIADEPFRTGEPNPCQCPDHPSRGHYLLSC